MVSNFSICGQTPTLDITPTVHLYFIVQYTPTLELLVVTYEVGYTDKV